MTLAQSVAKIGAKNCIGRSGALLRLPRPAEKGNAGLHPAGAARHATIIGAEVRWFYAYDGQDDDGYFDDALGQSGCRVRPHRQWQRLELEQAALWASGGSRR